MAAMTRSLPGWPLFLVVSVGVVLILPPGTTVGGWQSDFLHSFLGLVLEALPFLLIGGLMAGIIEVVIPDHWLPTLGRRLGPAGLPVVAGLSPLLPLCECGVVGIGRGLLRKGLPLPHTVTYLLAAPILNPIVLLTTWLAFSGRPEALLILGCRALGGFLVSITVGLILWRVPPERILVDDFREECETTAGKQAHAHNDHSHDHDDHHGHSHGVGEACDHDHGDCGHDHGHSHGVGEACDHDHGDCGHDHDHSHGGNRLLRVFDTARFEFVDMATWFVIGIAIAAALKTMVGSAAVGAAAGEGILGPPVMMAAAFGLSLCSEVDAFVAAGVPGLSIAAITAFLVFGPMIDIRLLLLYRSVIKTSMVFAFAGILTVVNLAFAWALWVLL
jgi:uncharacterized membrane protein YraQ (UPF0718 family)